VFDILYKICLKKPDPINHHCIEMSDLNLKVVHGHSLSIFCLLSSFQLFYMEIEIKSTLCNILHQSPFTFFQYLILKFGWEKTQIFFKSRFSNRDNPSNVIQIFNLYF